MLARAALVLAFLLALPAGAGEIAPEAIDLRLKFAAATMNHRLLVYETCVDGSCSSATYLQWFKTDWSADTGAEPGAPVRTILATCALEELTGDLLVHRAWWVTGSGADPVLRVATSPPAEPSPRHEARLTPGRPCDYSLARAALG